MPGIYSARWAGPDKDYSKAVQRIRDERGSKDDGSAHVLCVLALVWPDGPVELVEGRCDGKLVWSPRGNKGHGYDPWFVPEDHERTFAEMDPDEKNALSHRGKALRALAERYFSS
jgi:XTP/dITP diphosphohydrolase